MSIKKVKEFVERAIEMQHPHIDEYNEKLFRKMAIPLISNLLNNQRTEMIKEVEGEVEILRAEHANTARHGNTPDDAYNRVDSLLFHLKDKQNVRN